MSAPPRLPLARVGVIALLVVLPLFLRAHPIRHGMPRNYVPDTHVVRNALGMAATKNPVPRAGEFSNYPNLLPYCLLPLYLAWYGAGRATDAWDGPEEFGVHLLLQPAGAHAIARWLVLAFGVATPLVVAAAARAAGLRRGALVAGFLAATSVLHVQLSTHERPWVPMSFFIAVAAWQAIRAAQSPGWRTFLGSTVAASLAFATHPAGLLALGLPALAWLEAPLGWRGSEGKRRAGIALASVGLFAALALAVGYPHLVVHGATEDSAKIGGGAADVDLAGLGTELGISFDTFERLAVALVGYEPVLLVLGLAGLWPALRRRTTRGVTLWMLLWSAWFLTSPMDHVRYLIPSVLGLTLPAAYAAEWLLARRAGRVLLVLLLAVALVQATRLATVLARTDTRAQGEVLLAELPPGSRVAIDRYGPDVDLSADALARVEVIRARRRATLTARERRRVEALAAGRVDLVSPGIDALPLSEILLYDERAGVVAPAENLATSGATPAELIASFGVTHLLLVERRPRESGESGSLVAPVVAGREPLWVVDPSSGDGTREAFLPTEMDFPLTGLWTVERPGPRLALYELGPRGSGAPPR